MTAVPALMEAARAAQARAHAPYSRFRVGCALEADDGRIFVGCNVENASYGLTMCAERVALGAAIAAGARTFRRIAIVADAPDASPCGACRQVLAEFAPHLTVIGAGTESERTWQLDSLLPDRFVIDNGSVAPPAAEGA